MVDLARSVIRRACSPHIIHQNDGQPFLVGMLMMDDLTLEGAL